MPLSTGTKVRGHRVPVLVLGDQRIHLGLAHVSYGSDQVVDTPGIDRRAKARLGFDLVALGDRYVPHVVAEPRDPERTQRMYACCRTTATTDGGGDGWFGHVADDCRAFDAQTGRREGESRGHRARPG